MLNYKIIFLINIYAKDVYYNFLATSSIASYVSYTKEY